MNISMAAKMFIDEYRNRVKASGNTADMIMHEPVLTGESVIDVFLAGLAECIALRTGCPPPPWIESPTRFLKEVVVMGGKHSRPYMLEDTQECWGRRLLFCGEIEI